jgi:predicted metal-binding membrane protein
MDPEKLEALRILLPLIATVVLIAVGGWVLTTWMRIKHGYPLDGAWGQAVYPKKNEEAMERVKLLSQENAQLRAELGSVKDRLQNVERIVTDSSHRLAHEIDALRGPAN